MEVQCMRTAGLRLRLTNFFVQFSTSDSALTLTRACARCTRQGKIILILPQILAARLLRCQQHRITNLF